MKIELNSLFVEYSDAGFSRLSTQCANVDYDEYNYLEDPGEEAMEYGDFALIGRGVKGKRGGCGGGCVDGGAGSGGGRRAAKRSKAKLRAGVVYSAKHVRIQAAKKSC